MADGKEGDAPRPGGPLRRWLSSIDHSIDGELNRFFSPTERSRTGEVMDKYAQRVEASLQRATDVAKRTKYDLDAFGDETVERLFGRGPKRRKREAASIDWILKRPGKILVLMLVIVLFVSAPAVYITGNERLGVESSMRGDFEIFLPPKDETTEILDEVREHWSTDAMFIYIEMGLEANVTEVDILKALSAIEGDEDNYPGFKPADGSGYQDDLNWTAHGIDPWRDDDGEFDGVMAVLSLPMLVKVANQTTANIAYQMNIAEAPGCYTIPNDQAFVDRIVAQLPPEIAQSMVVDIDGDGTWDRSAIIVLLNKDPKIQLKVMEATEEIIEEVNGRWGETMKIYLTGPTPVIQAMQERTISEFFRVIPLVIVGLILALYLFHRTFKVIPIALLPVFLGLMMALGIIGLLHNYLAISPQVVIIAPVLLALGVSYGLYISNRFAEETEGERNVRITKAVHAINPAIMLSALTTGIGFASLMIGTLPPIFTMGLALTIGIGLTYVMVYILVPSLIVLLKYEKRTKTKGMKTFSTVPSRNRKKIILFALVAALISIALIPSVRFDADYLNMAPRDEPSVVKMQEYSRYMGGGQIGMFIVRRDHTEYSTLDQMEEMGVEVNAVENTQSLSVVDIMKAVQAPESVTVAGTTIDVPEQFRASLWDAIVYFEERHPGFRGPEYAQVLIDTFYETLPHEVREMLVHSHDTPSERRALIYCLMPFMDVEETRDAVGGVNDIVERYNDINADPSRPEFASKLTGIAAITLAVNDLIITSQFNSLAAAIFLTFLVLTIIFRSIKIGIMTIIPVLCVISLEPGTLVGLDIPLSTITVMIGSIAIGTGVDFSIQISQRVRLGKYKLPSVFGAVERAGTSFVEATTTMLAGFAMTLFIPIESIQEFVVMIMILLSYNAIFALLVLPAIYTIWIRRGGKGAGGKREGPPGRRRITRTGYERLIKKLFRIRDEPPPESPPEKDEPTEPTGP